MSHPIDHKEEIELCESVTAGDFDFERFESYSVEETLIKSRKLVRKIDWRVLPILVLLFILNILDRNNIANAKVSGLSTDLNLSGLDYNNIVVVTFVGYVFTQIPAGLILAKLPAAVFLSGAVMAWGIVSLCCGFVYSFGAITALRFLVGVCEAPFFPGALLILSSFYTRSEIATRIAIMYSGNSLSNGFGSILAAAIISALEGRGGLAGWRWLFIIEGAVTVAVGLAVLFVLPSMPSKTKWLSDEERRLAAWRVTCDAAGEPDEGGETSLLQGVRLVLKDWKILLLVFQQMFISCVQSFTYFFPSIVASLGFGANQTLLLSGPPYFFAFFASVGVAISSSKFDERAWHIAVPMLFSAVGNILVITLPFTAVGARYFAMFLMTLGTYCAFNLSFAWVTSTVPRPRIKRGATLSLVNGLSNASHFFTPYMFPNSDSPRYMAGGISLAVFCLCTVGTSLTIKYVLRHENKKLRALDESGVAYTGSLEGIPKGYRFAT